MKSRWNHSTILTAAYARDVAGGEARSEAELPILFDESELCPSCRSTRERWHAVRSTPRLEDLSGSICRHPFHEPLSLERMVAPIVPEQGPCKRWRRASEEQFSRILHRAANTLLGAAAVDRIEASHWAHAAAAYEAVYAAAGLAAETAIPARGQR